MASALPQLNVRLPQDVNDALETGSTGVKGGKTAVVVAALRYHLGLPAADDGEVRRTPLELLEEVGELRGRVDRLEDLARSQGAEL